MKTGGKAVQRVKDIPENLKADVSDAKDRVFDGSPAIILPEGTVLGNAARRFRTANHQVIKG